MAPYLRARFGSEQKLAALKSSESAVDGRNAAGGREPSRFATGCLVRRLQAIPERLALPTRCRRGPSAVRPALDREPSRFATGCLVRRQQPIPDRLALPTRCGRGTVRGPAGVGPRTVPVRSRFSGPKTAGYSRPPRPAHALRTGDRPRSGRRWTANRPGSQRVVLVRRQQAIPDRLALPRAADGEPSAVRSPAKGRPGFQGRFCRARVLRDKSRVPFPFVFRRKKSLPKMGRDADSRDSSGTKETAGTATRSEQSKTTGQLTCRGN
jgi:hypothetical protein